MQDGEWTDLRLDIDRAALARRGGMIVSFMTGDALEDTVGEVRSAAYASHVPWAGVVARVAWRLGSGLEATSDQHGALLIVSRLVMNRLLLSILGAVVSGFLLSCSQGNPIVIGALTTPRCCSSTSSAR